jgi:hypothetical protein
VLCVLYDYCDDCGVTGSERATKAGEIGDRLSEAQSINKSLTMLGLVISTLADKMKVVQLRLACYCLTVMPMFAIIPSQAAKKGASGDADFVPYRNAVL